MNRQQSSEQIRNRIIDEAARLIVAYGYDGIAMREIAEAAGLSKAGLYHHFRDKEDLLIAVLTNWADEMAALAAAAESEPTTRAQLTALVRGLFAQAPAQRALVRLSNQDMPRLSEPARASVERCYANGLIAPITAMIRAGIERGELRPVDPHLATWLLLGMLYPFFHTEQAKIGENGEAIADLIVTTFFDGLAQ
ncbi:TetR/AcrR family transcriptional regulator [Chloroflexus sp.]|uniref:TetR/AcrR family transcriptional regulator n=1 Tax=Chloroflexus sp. TaxID=1904827 RepID=UPI00298F3430|nr:TetR/AcrR family transcriptional regulator [Chloroflexus sp.]MCS6887535.1 TetR/AcrR family transcriptional regulator [Chloroflexus sp.]MCX7860048.1 TetR/AcrR family transcriptional regulator [Chloroflexus sp.]MDW8403673.1 TetR/AcrR family transcriptional regulator [Chloroflexus sp.]